MFSFEDSADVLEMCLSIKDRYSFNGRFHLNRIFVLPYYHLSHFIQDHDMQNSERHETSIIESEWTPRDQRTFELLFEALKKNEADFVDSSLKTTGFLLISLGWVVSSETTRAFFIQSSAAKLAAQFTIVAGAFTYIWITAARQNKSRQILARLKSMEYIDPSYLRFYATDWIYLVAALLFVLPIFTVLFFLISGL